MTEQQVDIAGFLQRFSAKSLWHFTGYNKTDDTACNILKNIINSQALKITDHPESLIMPKGSKRGIYAYSCLCDIPFKDLKIHIIRYGRFGIAFKKIEAIKRGYFNPLMYVNKDHPLFNRAEQLLKRIDELTTVTSEMKTTVNHFLGMLGIYIKRSDLTVNISISDTTLDQQQNNNFYYEREWRSAFQWNFTKGDIEAIMVPKSHVDEFRQLLADIKYSEIPIITYESVDNL